MTDDEREPSRGQWGAFLAQLDATFDGGRERAAEVDEAEREALLRANLGGVGLAAVVDACEQAGGAVSLSSEPGAGTTVRVMFPGTVACGACPATSNVSSASAHSTLPRLTHSTASRLRVGGDASSPARAQPY